MDLVRHLEYFVAIADERHFGHAAQHLGIRQPPLSQGLKRLESELGVQLLERDSQGVSLTDAGHALLPAALRVLDEVEQLRLLARRQDSPARPRVTVRVAPALGTGHYALVVAACHKALPDVDVDVSEQPTADQIHDLAAGRAQVGILREPVAARGVTFGPHVDLPLHCLLPADHPMAGADVVRLRDLSGRRLTLPPREHAPAAYDEIIATCERHGFLPGAVREAADDRVLHGLVASGSCVSFTTDNPGRGDGSTVVPIGGEPLTLRLRLAWRDELVAPLGQLPPAIVRALSRRPDRPMEAAAEAGSAPPVRPPRPASELPATFHLPMEDQ